VSDLTMEFTDTLVVVTCWCGINHAVPENLRNFQLRQHRNGQTVQSIYCPLGHTHAPAGKGEAEKLREKLEREQQLAAEARRRAQAERDLREDTERRLAAQKGATTRARKRAAAAVCPCCNRTFQQLARHLVTKHPDYVPDATP
jgi:hypothetical protein